VSRRVLAGLLGLAAIVAVTVAPNALAGSAAVYRNPVYDHDFPDPFVLAADGVYWAYATNDGWNVQTLRSPNGFTWVPVTTDALPRMPAWALPGETWAPEVVAIGGRYVMWYATRRRGDGVHCLSRAIAMLPQGPFSDPSTGPALCLPDHGGVIDPSPFVDGRGQAWLTWKSEGRGTARTPATIWGARLSADGLAFTSLPAALVRADQPWEGGVVEAPTLVQDGGRTYLFYSGNRWDTAGYAVGWARCSGPLGPCQKDPRPVFGSGGSVAGPGGQTVFRDSGGGAWLGYHGWSKWAVGYPRGYRSFRIEHLAFAGGRPVVSGPNDTITVAMRG
jgi:beta-xylosidase